MLLEEMNYDIRVIEELAMGDFKFIVEYIGEDKRTREKKIIINVYVNGEYDIEIDECKFICKDRKALSLLLQQFSNSK